MNTLLIILLLLILLIPAWALFGGDSKEKNNRSKSNDDNFDRDLTMRRRAADLEIEKEQKLQKNESDDNFSKPKQIKYSSDSLKKNEIDENNNFKLPFKSKEILDNESPYSFFNKTLENAEAYMQKGDYQTASSLYEGVKKRIKDKSLVEKLDENIDYLSNYQQIIAHKQEINEQLQNQELSAKNAEQHGIKLSFEGNNNIPDKIQIGITPPSPEGRFDIDSIVEKISDKLLMQRMLEKKIDQGKLDDYENEIDLLKNKLESITNKKIDAPENSENIQKNIQNQIEDIELEKEKIDKKNQEFENNINEIKNLKNEIEQLKSLKNNIDNSREQKIEKDYNEILKMQNRLMDYQGNDLKNQDEINKLKDEIKQLKSIPQPGNQPHVIENQNLKEDIARLEKEINELSKEKNKTDKLEKKIKELENQNFQYSNRELNSKLEEISSLKDELKQMNDALKNISSQTSIPESDIKPVLAESKFQSSMEDMNINKNIQETFNTPKENKDEDFELLNEYIKGPQYNAPTEDEIYEKILNDAVKETSKNSRKDDYEIIGEKKDSPKEISFEDIMDSETEKKREQEEAFYAKFLQPDKVKKKELPILKVSYDFTKLSNTFNSSRKNQNAIELSFSKYKPLLEKAKENIKRKRVHSAIDYYRVVMDQNIPDEFKRMIKQNIDDLNDYLEKYYVSD